MRKHAAWLVFAATIALVIGGSIHARAQSNALSMSLTFGGSIVPTINVNQAAAVPQCSKAANCSTQIVLCNRAAGAYGSVQGGGGGCVILNGNAHTLLDLSINDVKQAAGTTAPTSTNFPVGNIDLSGFPNSETNIVP